MKRPRIFITADIGGEAVQRLVDSGELEKYLVDPPSKAMAFSSKVLGATLIIIGLIELVLVLNGFFAH